MPPDPAEVREWIDKARADLRVAVLLLAQDDRVLDACGFHAQHGTRAFLADREAVRLGVETAAQVVERVGRWIESNTGPVL